MTELDDIEFDDNEEEVLRKGDVCRLARMGSTVSHQRVDLRREVQEELKGQSKVVRIDLSTIYAITHQVVLTREDLDHGMHFSNPNGKQIVARPSEYGSMAVYRQ